MEEEALLWGVKRLKTFDQEKVSRSWCSGELASAEIQRGMSQGLCPGTSGLRGLVLP